MNVHSTKNLIRDNFDRVPLLIFFLIVPLIGFAIKPSNQWTEMWSCVHFGGICILLLWILDRSMELQFPRLRKDELAILTCLILLKSISIVTNFRHIFWLDLLEELIFLVTTLYLLHLFKDKNFNWCKWIAAPSVVALLANLILATHQILSSPGLRLDEPVIGTFSNQNMFAEGLGLMWCLILPTYSKLSKQLKLAFIGVAGWSIGVIVLGNSRSVLLSIGIFCLIVMRISGFKLMSWLVLLFFVSIFLVIPHHFSERLELLRSSLHVIANNPLGVGIGHYPFAVLPYEFETIGKLKPNLIVNSPHNTFLKYSSEEGLLFGITTFVLLISIVFRGFGENHGLMIGLVALLGVSLLLQFPEENPYTFIGLCVLTAKALEERELIQFKRAKFAEFAIFIFTLLSIVTTFGFRYAHLNYPIYSNPGVSKFMCELSADFWRRCVDATSYYAQQGDYNVAFQTTKNGLQRLPNNYILFREYIHIEAKSGLPYCQDLTIYYGLFKNLPEFFGLVCPSSPLITDGRAWELYEARVKAIINKL